MGVTGSLPIYLEDYYGDSPPYPSIHSALYEASRGTLNASDVAANEYEKLKTWQDLSGNGHHLVQATVANQLRIRRNVTPVVYSNFVEGATNLPTFPQSTVSIDNQAASLFFLIEDDRLMTNGVAETKVIMGLAGGVGDLYSLAPASAVPATLVWRDGVNGTVDTGLRLKSSLTLVGVILRATGITIVLDDLSYEIASPLAPGTTTGFSLFSGSLAGLTSGFMGGINCAVPCNEAVDSTKLAAFRAWAVGRKAIPASSVSKQLFIWGASIASGQNAQGNLGFARQYILGKTDLMCVHEDLGGITAVQMTTRAPVISAINNQPVGTRFYDPTKRQVVLVYPPTNDLPNDATSAATIITEFTDWRNRLMSYGYRTIFNAFAPRGDLTAVQNTKRLAVNAAMAALDPRKYGVYVPTPIEMRKNDTSADASDRQYYDPDTIHLTATGHSVILRACRQVLDGFMNEDVTTEHFHLRFNGNLLDSGLYTRDFEAVGAPTYTSGLWSRQALVCTTGNNYARYPVVNRAFDQPYFTAVIWFKTSHVANMQLVSKYQGSGTNWYLGVTSAGNLFCGTNGMAGLSSAGTNYRDNAWHMAAFVTDAIGGKLYASPDENPANLVLKASGEGWTGGPLAPDTGTAYLRCGADNSASYNVTVQDMYFFLGTKALAELQALTPWA